MIRSFRLIGAAVAALALLALAGGSAGAADGRVPQPNLVVPKGECVAPTEIMRKNHPDFLKTQRDETVHQGIRSGKYSLTGCVACHATADPKAADPTVKTIAPFCDQCHTYAAVKLDCWSCHTPKLTDAVKKEAETLFQGADQKALFAELKAHLAEGGASQ